MHIFYAIVAIYVIGMFFTAIAVHVNNNLYNRRIVTDFVKDDEWVLFLLFWPLIVTMHIVCFIFDIIKIIFSKIVSNISNKITDIVHNVIIVYRKMKEME